MAAHELSTPGLALAVLLGAVVLIGGLVLATDYRGISTWHATRTVQMMSPVHRRVGRVAPWRWLPQDQAGRIRRQTQIDRTVGAGFILIGGSLAIAGVVSAAARLL